MARTLRGGPGELFYPCAADVRAALALADVPTTAQLLTDLAADAEARAARSPAWSDPDIDADLPLPADCVGEWSRVSNAAGRLRAVEMHQLARFALIRLLRQDDGADAVDAALRYGETTPRGDRSMTGGIAEIPSEPLVHVLERLTAPEDYLSLNATMRTRLGSARRETGRALAAFLGLPQTLSATVSGTLPFNRIDRLLHRVVSAQLTVRQMNAVDDMATQLRPEISLDQFERRVREFIRTCFDPPVRSPECIHRDRSVRLIPEADGSGALVLSGPLLPLTLSYERIRATARAMRRQELAGLEVDGGDPTLVDGEGTLETLDDRTIEQYMFDLAAGAVPQTDVRVVRVTPGTTRTGDGHDEATAGGNDRPHDHERRDRCGRQEGPDGRVGRAEETDRAPDARGLQEESFIATVSCPTDGAWLRKQAAVTVTMSLSTLMGLGDECATLGHATPLPAAQARQAATHATVWHRMLYDPATGTVTDEATRTYAPTAAMRRAVEHKWRSCMAPGCTRSSTLCEIDHCEPFWHDDPGRGGPTHPCNLIPLCVTHHQLKTNGVIRLRRVSGDEVEWVLPLGVVTRSVAPPSDPGPRRTAAAEEGLGFLVRSEDFAGNAVDELLHGAPRRTDLLGGTLITLVMPPRTGSCGPRGGRTAGERPNETRPGDAQPAEGDAQRRGEERPGQWAADDDPPPF